MRTEARLRRQAWWTALVAGASFVFAAWNARADDQNGVDPRDVHIGGSKLSRTSGSAHVIRKEQLDRFEHDDPHAVVATVPGVYVRGEDGYGLRPNIGIRGASSDRSKKLTLMEDGVLFAPAPYSAPAAYYFPILTRMQSVRVIKGPAAIQYGPQTVGGAIDLVTQDIPNGRGGTLDLAYGQYGYNKLHGYYGAGDERLGFLVEGIHLGASGFKDLDGGGDTGFSRNEWMVKTRFVPSLDDRLGNELSLKLGYSDEISNESYLGLSDEDFARTPYRRYLASKLDRMQWKRTQLQLSHKVKLAPGLDLTSTLYRHDLDRVWRKVNGFRGEGVYDVLTTAGAQNDAYRRVLTGELDAASPAQTILIGPNDRRFVSQGFQTVARWNLPGEVISQRIEYGLRLHYDEAERLHTEDGFVMTNRALVPEARPTALTADNTASTHAMAVHLVDAVTIGPVTTTPGIRFESIHSRLEDRRAARVGSAYHLVALPGAGAFVQLPWDVGLLAGVHKGFSPAPPGEPRAKTEASVNYEAGVRLSKRHVRAEIIGFYNDYSNVTNVCTLSNGCLGTNLDRQLDGGAARIYGVEVYVDAEPKTRIDDTAVGFPMRASYTFTSAQFLSDFTSPDPIFGRVRAGDDMPYVPAHQAYASAGIETSAVGLNVAGTVVDRMRERAGQGEPAPGERTDAHFLLDASTYYRPVKWLKIYLNARNMLDQAYVVARRPYGARPGAPFWLQLGMKIEL
jgi:Fe(3+) dicitrate transport protein